MPYEITTTINGAEVTVRCDEASARVLLALWAKAEPNLTHCRNLSSGETIVCFLTQEDDTPAVEITSL